MSFLKRLFGIQAEPPSPTVDAGRMLDFFNADGQQVRISHEEFRQTWADRARQFGDQPDLLYNILAIALEEGEDILSGAEKLTRIDPDLERAYCLHGMALFKSERLDEAEQVFKQCLNRHGPSAYASLNLAKVYAVRGDETRAIESLKQTLLLDPNQDNALSLLGAIRQEKEGVKGFFQAMEEIAALNPEGWRARLWLGKQHVGEGRISQAVELYQQVLDLCHSHPEAVDFIAKDLTEQRELQALWDVLSTRYQPKKHSVAAGIKLLQAAAKLNLSDAGLKMAEEILTAHPEEEVKIDVLIRQLKPLDPETHAKLVESMGISVPDNIVVPPAPPTETIKPAIAQITPPELIPVHSSTPPVPDEADIVPVERPIWYSGLFDPQWLLPKKAGDSETVGFMPLANLSVLVEKGGAAARERDMLDHLTRTVPLFLAELLYFHSAYQPKALIPVTRGHGPVISTAEWSRRQIMDLARRPVKNFWSMMAGYLRKDGEQLVLCMDVWDVPNHAMRGRIEMDGMVSDLGSLVFDLATHLSAGLDGMQPLPEAGGMDYVVPTSYQLGNYLTGLGMSLMLALAKNGIVSREALGGEANMLDWFYTLATNSPDVHSAKIMFLSGLSNLHSLGSTAYVGFHRRALVLLEKEANPQTPFSRLAPVIYWLYRMKPELDHFRQNLPKGSSDAYRQWVEQIPQL